MKIYCSACGHPNAYTSKKPKFCNECGIKLGTPQTKAAISSVPEPLTDTGEGTPNEEEIETVPHLGGLDVEIEPFGKAKGITLGEVVDSPESMPPPDLDPAPKKRGRRKKKTKKEKEKFLQDCQKEAGAIRRTEKRD